MTHCVLVIHCKQTDEIRYHFAPFFNIFVSQRRKMFAYKCDLQSVKIIKLYSKNVTELQLSQTRHD